MFSVTYGQGAHTRAHILGFLLDNVPLAVRTDRLLLGARTINPHQLVSRLLGQGRVLFYLGENGFVKEFRLPSIVALIDRYPAATLLRPGHTA